MYDREGLLTASLDFSDIIRSKLDFDVIGHYSRDDLLRYEVNDQPSIIREDDFPPPED